MPSTDASFTDVTCQRHQPFQGLVLLLVGASLVWMGLRQENILLVLGAALALSGVLLLATTRFVRVWKHGGEITYQVGQKYLGLIPSVSTMVYRGVKVTKRERRLKDSTIRLKSHCWFFGLTLECWILRLTGGANGDGLAMDVARFRSEAAARDFAALLSR